MCFLAISAGRQCWPDDTLDMETNNSKDSPALTVEDINWTRLHAQTARVAAHGGTADDAKVIAAGAAGLARNVVIGLAACCHTLLQCCRCLRQDPVETAESRSKSAANTNKFKQLQRESEQSEMAISKHEDCKLSSGASDGPLRVAIYARVALADRQGGKGWPRRSGDAAIMPRRRDGVWCRCTRSSESQGRSGFVGVR